MRQMREDKPGRPDGGPQQQPDPNEAGRARSGGRRQSDLGSSLARAGLLCLAETLRLGRPVFLGEVLVFSVHAIDLAWSATPQAHRRAPKRALPTTQATGSKNGERSRSRPLARGWEAPVDRLGNRSPASQGTRLCGGRGVFIGVSLRSNPTGSQERDTELRKISPTERDRSRCAWRAEPPAGCERVVRPCGTSLATIRARDRTPRNRHRPRADFPGPVADRERADARGDDQPEVVPQQSETLDVDASVGRLHPTLPRPERQRDGQRGLDRAATAERTAAIVNAREEALLERVGDVRTARRTLSRAARVSNSSVAWL